MPVRFFRGAATAVLLACCLSVAVPGAFAREVINEFASFVTVRPDGSMLVREEITATSEGDKIKTGIYRDFPLDYSGPEKNYRGKVPFALVTTSLDGKDLGRTDDTALQGNAIRIFLRDGSKKLEPGRHRFVLEYETALHLRFFEQYDELNWNVTGAGWEFPIERASCRVTLPDGVPAKQTAGWLGNAGDKTRGLVAVSRPAPNTVQFVGKREIQRGAQLTVALNFPKGGVDDPMPAALEEQERQRAAITGNPLFVLLHEAEPYRGAFSVLLVLAYFGIVWFFKGKDPAGGGVIPCFSPPVAEYMGKKPRPADFHPAPMSPMAVDYLRTAQEESPRAFAALFLSLAARGLCGLEKNAQGVFVLIPREGAGLDLAGLSPEERALHAELLRMAGTEGTVALDRSRRSELRDLWRSAIRPVRVNYAATWTFNARWTVLGWVLVIPLGACLHFLTPELLFGLEEGLVPTIIMTLFSLLGWGLAISCLLGGSKLGFAKMALIGFLCTWGLPVSDSLGGYWWLPPVLMLGIGTVFGRLMKAPTKEAQRRLDDIAGLRMYMAAAEQDRLQMLNRPDDTPEVFERLLPYALVLGLEQTWCDRFADQIAAGMPLGGRIGADGLRDAAGMNVFMHEFSKAAESAVPSGSSGGSGSAFGSGGGGSGSGSGGGGGGGI